MHVAFQGCRYLHLLMALLDGRLPNEVTTRQPGDEGPRLQMWLGSIRQDQECSLVGFVFGGKWWGWEAGQTERINGEKKEWKTLLILA